MESKIVTIGWFGSSSFVQLEAPGMVEKMWLLELGVQSCTPPPPHLSPSR